MFPQAIMVIRHAEKPLEDGSKTGIQEDGSSDPESLIVQGWQRAGALAHFFGGQLPNALGAPSAIFASGIAPHSKSRRPQQTILPLCAKLKADGRAPLIDVSHSKGDETAMLADVMKQQGTVLISWQHEAIPDIANAILRSSTASPQKWPGSRFDLVWVFEAQAGGGWRFSQVPQLLLAGDLDRPIG
jgi:hypothetical protein